MRSARIKRTMSLLQRAFDKNISGDVSYSLRKSRLLLKAEFFKTNQVAKRSVSLESLVEIRESPPISDRYGLSQ